MYTNAVKYFKEKKFDQAINEYISINDSTSIYNIGYIYFLQKNYYQSFLYFKQCYSLHIDIDNNILTISKKYSKKTLEFITKLTNIIYSHYISDYIICNELLNVSILTILDHFIEIYNLTHFSKRKNKFINELIYMISYIYYIINDFYESYTWSILSNSIPESFKLILISKIISSNIIIPLNIYIVRYLINNFLADDLKKYFLTNYLIDIINTLLKQDLILSNIYFYYYLNNFNITSNTYIYSIFNNVPDNSLHINDLLVSDKLSNDCIIKYTDVLYKYFDKQNILNCTSIIIKKCLKNNIKLTFVCELLNKLNSYDIILTKYYYNYISLNVLKSIFSKIINKKYIINNFTEDLLILLYNIPNCQITFEQKINYISNYDIKNIATSFKSINILIDFLTFNKEYNNAFDLINKHNISFNNYYLFDSVINNNFIISPDNISHNFIYYILDNNYINYIYNYDINFIENKLLIYKLYYYLVLLFKEIDYNKTLFYSKKIGININNVYKYNILKDNDYENKHECSICLDDPKYIFCKLNCSHIFHHFCMSKWTHNTCPLCRSNLNVI